MKRRFRVFCRTCGEIEADTDDGMYDKTTAYRRAGFHEGVHDGEHTCFIEETNDCHAKDTHKDGEFWQARDGMFEYRTELNDD